MRSCPTCHRSSKRAASRSYSNIRTWRRQYINIQKVNGRYQCTRCLKTQRTAARTLAL